MVAARQQAPAECLRTSVHLLLKGVTTMINIELEFVSDVNLDQALSILARTLAAGGRTHRAGAWRSKPVQKHLQHARKHLDLLASGYQGEDHLAHAACRLLMALELRARTAQARAARPTAADAATDSEQMPLFASVAPTRQT
jgi:hypothetical protein